MARINNISTYVQSIKTVEELARFTSIALDAILKQFNGKIDFTDNIRTFGPVAVEFSTTLPTKINHGLGRTPIGFLVADLDAAAIIYSPNRTSFPWTEEQIFLQANTPVTASILIF